MAAALILIATSGSATGAYDRTCGVLPGDGAYSYVKVKNVSCRTAKRVSRRAAEKFCGRRYEKCDRPPSGGFDRGRVRAKRWKCEMKVGYELYRAKCHRANKRFIAKSAA